MTKLKFAVPGALAVLVVALVLLLLPGAAEAVPEAAPVDWAQLAAAEETGAIPSAKVDVADAVGEGVTAVEQEMLTESAAAEVGAGTMNRMSTAAATGGVHHTVQRGENLYRISLRYGVDMSTLAHVNGIANVNRIAAGQVLWIPNYQAHAQPPATHPPVYHPPVSDYGAGYGQPTTTYHIPYHPGTGYGYYDPYYEPYEYDVADAPNQDSTYNNYPPDFSAKRPCELPRIIEFYAVQGNPVCGSDVFTLHYDVANADMIEIFGQRMRTHSGIYTVQSSGVEYWVLWAKKAGTPDYCYVEKAVRVDPTCSLK